MPFCRFCHALPYFLFHIVGKVICINFLSTNPNTYDCPMIIYIPFLQIESNIVNYFPGKDYVQIRTVKGHDSVWISSTEHIVPVEYQVLNEII